MGFFFHNQAGNFATTSSCQSADWLALVLLNRLTDWVQFVRLHIIISLKANMFLPFRHQHSTQCVLDLEISHVSVNQGLRKSDDRIYELWMMPYDFICSWYYTEFLCSTMGKWYLMISFTHSRLLHNAICWVVFCVMKT